MTATATASAPRIAFFRREPDGHLRLVGSAPVPGTHTYGKVLHLDSRRTGRAVRAPVTLDAPQIVPSPSRGPALALSPLPPAIHEAAVEALTTMLLAELARGEQ